MLFAGKPSARHRRQAAPRRARRPKPCSARRAASVAIKSIVVLVQLVRMLLGWNADR